MFPFAKCDGQCVTQNINKMLFVDLNSHISVNYSLFEQTKYGNRNCGSFISKAHRIGVLPEKLCI